MLYVCVERRVQVIEGALVQRSLRTLRDAPALASVAALAIVLLAGAPPDAAAGRAISSEFSRSEVLRPAREQGRTARSPVLGCKRLLGGWDATCLARYLTQSAYFGITPADATTAELVAYVDRSKETIAALLLQVDHGRNVDAFLQGRRYADDAEKGFLDNLGRASGVVSTLKLIAQVLERANETAALRVTSQSLDVLSTLLNSLDIYKLALRLIAYKEAKAILEDYIQDRERGLSRVATWRDIRETYGDTLVLLARRAGVKRDQLDRWFENAWVAYRLVHYADSADIRHAQGRAIARLARPSPPPPPPPSPPPPPLPPPPLQSCLGKLATLVGTEGNDALDGTAGNDVIVALGGDDVVNGLSGDDVLCGGGGDDRIDGGAGSDGIDSGSGVDTCLNGEAEENCSAPPVFVFASAVPENDRTLIESAIALSIRFLRARAAVASDGFTVTVDRGSLGDTSAYAGKSGIRVFTGSRSWQEGSHPVHGPGHDRYKILAHEYSHVVQFGLFSTFRARGTVGWGWLIEGSAELAGFHTASAEGNLDFAQGRSYLVEEAKLATGALNTCSAPVGRTPCVYTLGAIATEFLLAEAQGYASLMTFWKLQGDGVSREEAFQSVFGRSIETFYAEFEEYRGRLTVRL